MNRALPRDPALPHLAVALDGTAMTEVFARELPAGLSLLRCEVDRIKYRPRRNCSVSYRLALRESASGRHIEQAVGTRWCASGQAAARHAKASSRAPLPTAAGPAFTHVAAFDLFASWWPNDPKLPALAGLSDAARLRTRTLPAVVAALDAGDAPLIDHRMTLVQWVPEHRATLRVQLRRGDGRTQVVFAKTDSEHDAFVAHQVLQTIAASPAQAERRLRTPRSLFVADGVHWQSEVTGAALLDIAPQVSAQHSAEVGELLAALHATPVATERGLTREGLMKQPRETAALLGSVEPAWWPLLDRLVSALEREPLPEMEDATLHGDLHPRNLLCSASGLALIDLDSVHRGPAVIELGSWIADLLVRALCAGESPRSAAPAWQAFLDAYGSTNRLPEASLIAWSTARALLCERAYRAVTNLKSGRLEQVPALLALAGRIADAGRLDA